MPDGFPVVSVVTRRSKLLCRLGMLTLWLASGAGLKTIVERPQPCRRKWYGRELRYLWHSRTAVFTRISGPAKLKWPLHMALRMTERLPVRASVIMSGRR